MSWWDGSFYVSMWKLISQSLSIGVNGLHWMQKKRSRFLLNMRNYPISVVGVV